MKMAMGALYREVVLALPDEFSRLRCAYYNARGATIAYPVSLSPNVRLKGRVTIGPYSSLAQNCSVAGGEAGVTIGSHVMIAPNVVIVAFSHGTLELDRPMVAQPNVEKPVVISDDVWIGANVTIAMGVTIGRGAIVGANSLVNRDVEPFTIVGGVPARVIAHRQADA